MNRKILIVDDEAAIREICGRILRTRQYEVATASGVTEAKKQILSTEYGLVITDLRMGDEHGEDLIKIVKAGSPGTGVIVMTGYSDINNAVACMKTGADDYLPKPFEMKALLDCVNGYFETKDLKQEVIKLRELDELKTVFLANVSHELRTPLTAIKGAMDLCDKIGTDENRREKIMRIVKNNTERMLVLVGDLLKAAETDDAQIKLKKSEMDIHVCLSHAIAAVKHKAEEKNIVFDYKKVSPVFVFCDKVRIEQIFINLLDNAVKFSPRGSAVKIHVSASGGDAKILVSDSGSGITTEDLQKVFGRFYQSRTSLAHKAKGFGLGLSIVKQLAEMHDGKISVTSPPQGKEKGAEFTVILPLIQVPPKTKKSET